MACRAILPSFIIITIEVVEKFAISCMPILACALVSEMPMVTISSVTIGAVIFT